ncbi:RNA 2',3'-cyclic phosphodiesterase [Streptomyces sp. SL13]|uniref:RNA 2',3'-cyclic phosphodiesterase n=1 Tax=Streptantibioticus silvisoli TaxID=2705255 RepID=A0AA90GXC9_9ACTN|nr:RNA 2',3'-cyclic phosphodiesterase [Streptantibioticus silvisoli]MDI5969609.1 RNA 2',3'-cyclic phosphodiesterase [Streptantibioticus silvisoli]
MRLFVAVTPPAAVLGELARAIGPLTTGARAGRLRWTEASGRHVTLAFLGATDPGVTLPALTERLARTARRHPPMTLRLASAGRFGATVLWAAVTGETAALSRLAASVTEGARHAGIALEDRPFRPHLTLARARPDATPDDLRSLAAELAPVTSAPWTADRLQLIRSHARSSSRRPGGAGPRYETVGQWELTGPQ